MRKHYDFSKGKKNPSARRLKRQVTIRLDEDTLAYFKKLAEDSEVPYQTLINLFLRDDTGGIFLGIENPFFEANYWNPQVFVKNAIPPLGRWAGEAHCQIGLRKYRLMQMTSRTAGAKPSPAPG